MLTVLQPSPFAVTVQAALQRREPLPVTLPVLLQFLTPIFFPVSALPPVFQQVIQWNPLTVLIEQVRALVFDAQWPSLQLWVQSLSINLVLAVIAYALFRRVRKGFADVI